MYTRTLRARLAAALADTPVVLIQGPRQAGKSTLAGLLMDELPGGRYLTLDDPATLAAAHADPAGFIDGFSGPVALDEIQRAPGLFLAIKAAVDRDRRPGRFLLTGSADVLLLPRVAESLAGRMEPHVLWPLSQGELEGRPETLLEHLWAPGDLPPVRASLRRDELATRICQGGFPDAVTRTRPERREAWFEAYLATMLQRDVRELAAIERATELPRLFNLLATRTASLLNHAELSRTLGLPQSTLKRYMALFELVFLHRELPAWSGNLSKRLVKAPKLIIADTGLAAFAAGINEARLLNHPDPWGPLLENFVAVELLRQLAGSGARVRLYHYRSHTGQEVDFILEDPQGRLVGIEVKARQSLDTRDFQGLKGLAADLPERFVRGVVLYTGSETVSFGERLVACPVETLWRLP